MIRIGIDPGISGAVAILDSNLSLVTVYDMPTMPLSKGKNQVNAAALASKLKESTLVLRGDTTAYLEAVHSMPEQGVSSSFNFGVSYGVIQGVLAALNIPVVPVTPQTWKKRAGLVGKDKDHARTVAQQLYPQAPLERKRDIGRADAILIARFGEIITK